MSQFAIILDGRELALLESAMEMSSCWPFPRAGKRPLEEEEQQLAARLAPRLYRQRKALLIAASAFLPPITPVPSLAFLDRRAAIRGEVSLARAELEACRAVLRFCYEAFTPREDELVEPEEWSDFCASSSGDLEDFLPPSHALLELCTKLERLLVSGGDGAAVRELASEAAAGPERSDEWEMWPPRGAIELSLSRLESELLLGALFMPGLAVSMFGQPAARRLLAAYDERVSNRVARYLRTEDRFTRQGGITPETPPPKPVLVRPEHLQACLQALAITELEFVPSWSYFCQTATPSLYRFEAARPEDLLRLKHKLERLLIA